METSIFVDKPGNFKEINAEEISKQSNLKRGTFLCPECGEDVMLRMSNTIGRKNYFAHYSNEITIECERRVSSNELLNVYKRLSVPLYLSFSKKRGYTLNFGLKSIGIDLLKQAESNKAYIQVKVSKNNTRTVNIDRFNFTPDELNLFQIDHYPSYNKPFLIDYIRMPREINKWASHIDPVTEAGILFSVNSNVGKSIRHGDTVYSDEKYLWLSPKKLKGEHIMDRNADLLDVIRLNNQDHYIYNVQFIKQDADYKQFNEISQSLHDRLKVILLKSKNKINLIWPPSIRTEEGYFLSSKGRIHTTVGSLNSNPVLFLYSDNGYAVPKQLEMKKIQEQNYLDINLNENEIQLSMDRRITSTGINLKFQRVTYEGRERYLKLTEKVERDLEISQEIDYLNFNLAVNSKIKCIRIDKNKRIDVFNHVSEIINWTDLKYGDQIYLFNYDYLIARILLNKTKNNLNISVEELMFYSKIPQKHNHLTTKYRHIIIELINKDTNYRTVFDSILKRNSIPYFIQQKLGENHIND